MCPARGPFRALCSGVLPHNTYQMKLCTQAALSLILKQLERKTPCPTTTGKGVETCDKMISKKGLMYLYNNSWVKVSDPQKLRVAMCEIYPDSAPEDWMLRLRHWHVPAAISPLHDKDTYDEDKKTIMYKLDDKTKEPILKDGEPVPCTDPNGEIVYEVHHRKGEYKKPHYHVMIAYGNATTPNTFKKIIRNIGGVVPPWEHMEVCSVMSMYRYFAHLDDPDKHQYNISDVVLLGGFDPVNYQTYADKNEPFNEVLLLLKKHKEITSYKSLCEYYRGRDSRLFYFCCNHTLTLKGWFADRK